MKAVNPRITLNLESIYVIGAAGFWLNQMSDEKRIKRIAAALDKKFDDVASREHQRILHTRDPRKLITIDRDRYFGSN
jgi:hypothetical protein